ncbi:carbamoyltransferase HypF [Lacrimispora amygdalina]|uniref:Carbamoyltransferase n=1 Tax=Lacrimispora amygdalina TaxID=253257 RepID=A0A3E2NI69_9FIRM|nr:carbamoyltransferase HypF [Clostridium indicum]RFZ80665.1 carbamoyltransferase HypF [Clostridium indicum]
MDNGKNTETAVKIKVCGIVQGVGFRPLVYRAAREMGIKGWVRNVGGDVEIVAQASKTAVDRFLSDLKENNERRYEILNMEMEELPVCILDDFVIIPSGEAKEVTMIPPDLPVCPDCLKELDDDSDRRSGNPFISCMSCGPRYTIIEDMPYDRDNTAMKDFPMCSVCKKEYTSPQSRRFHAQTISCNDCGPYLLYRDNRKPEAEEFTDREALKKAIKVLAAGGIVAVKGIGGYHLACSPFLEQSAVRLRQCKGREEKPFAVMFHSLTEIKKYCNVSMEEEALLKSKAKPVVLLHMKEDLMAPSTNKKSVYCGAFLPYTPLQHLLTAELGPLIMTSANVSGQPIIREDDCMLSLSDPFIDGVLYNKRRIVRSVDDSVAKIVAGSPQLIRRSRGYVPYPVFLNKENAGETDVFAAGGDLKAAFCLCRKERAVVSQYFGDLEECVVMEEYKKSYKDLTRLLNITPGLAVCDLHPNYHSARFARSLLLPIIKVQHHHAHIASVMAEHGLKGPVIGVAFDGTGYGTDGSIWGGEFLICEGKEFVRAAHLSPFPILGGDQSMRDGKKTAICYLHHAGLDSYFPDERKHIITAALDQRINTVFTSSMGRLFDAAASVLHIANENRYEGECAILLEREAELAKREHIKPPSLPFLITEEDDVLKLDPKPFFEASVRYMDSEKTGALALSFHHAAAEGIAEICDRLRSRYHISEVALSGGVFQNTVLTERTITLLRERGFRVYINRLVPPGDGGLSLGQIYLGREHLKAVNT